MGSNIKAVDFTGEEDESAPFTFTIRSDTNGKPITGNGSDAGVPIVIHTLSFYTCTGPTSSPKPEIPNYRYENSRHG
ncbi:uncharacterized protein PITG_12255 [Phytophthora infestans T30-4]|uniref:Uncharacterized protein n=1 Tax=Phytophthora infestans (strain T30-4) TaxID=403677 RepID=D0NJE8_PHYIT|nr:uncharacterized protein PITG_12255 [Phytophthora infestans T30-4]EEY59666.1 hypothetical protein PITG_12255 [Phytophthora infestans T30-4]|eukprot:XP_002900859.1 hypothetical protein PITG_12255 [Phytophthora infestans T30-4]